MCAELLLLANSEVPATWIAGFPWVLHLLGVVLWVGGLLAVCGQTVRAVFGGYPAAERTSILSALRTLHHQLVAPGFLLALVGGLWSLIAFHPEKLQQGWFHGKLGLVVLLLGVNFAAVSKLYDLLRQPESSPGRWLLALPVSSLLIPVAILLLIRYKPF